MCLVCAYRVRKVDKMLAVLKSKRLWVMVAGVVVVLLQLFMGDIDKQAVFDAVLRLLATYVGIA